MAVDLKGYRVFIATPGGLAAEREAFRKVINDYNEMDALSRGVCFIPIGWEETLGAIGRPQELINEDLRECDYFVLVLYDRWGSPPTVGSEGRYSSGTEEEFYVALECLRAVERPMRQLVVFFRAVDDARLSDPGEQLSKVLDFKQKLEKEKFLLFHTYDDNNSFEARLRTHLAKWIRDHERPSLT